MRNPSLSAVGNMKEEKKSNVIHDRKGREEQDAGGVTEKMLAMHNALDDGYGSSNSSPHSAGKSYPLVPHSSPDLSSKQPF